jgi:peptidoglycan hydrolase-like protein with peptidoglycan-binding domain
MTRSRFWDHLKGNIFMKFATQAAVAALAAALLAMPALAQSQFNPPPAQQRQGPLPPTGSPSDYQRPATAQTMQQQRPMRSSRSASSQSVRDLQAALNKNGANLEVDGKMGPKTREALRKYQSANNLRATGSIDAETRTKLGISPSVATSPAPSSRPMATAPARSSPPMASPSTPSSSGSRALEPARPNNSGSAPNPANTPSRM